jgi:hypothetical protein
MKANIILRSARSGQGDVEQVIMCDYVLEEKKKNKPQTQSPPESLKNPTTCSFFTAPLRLRELCDMQIT